MAEPELPNDALAKAIAALEAQRPVLGSAIVDAALAPLLAQQHASHRAAPPRRRQVSVLFLDVVGSTALSQTIDPEDVLDIMDSALQSFSARVVERGGKVLQYAGDSLLAAFGAETAREDDAERAVLAGLDLLAEARLQAERIARTHGQEGFQVRVGIHTGHVLLGGGTHGGLAGAGRRRRCARAAPARAGDGRAAAARRQGRGPHRASPHARRPALHREIAAEWHEHLGPAPMAIADRP